MMRFMELEYEANLESGEKVKVWRKAKIVGGSRTVRLDYISFILDVEPLL